MGALKAPPPPVRGGGVGVGVGAEQILHLIFAIMVVESVSSAGARKCGQVKIKYYVNTIKST